jgi:hypothetical protein
MYRILLSDPLQVNKKAIKHLGTTILVVVQAGLEEYNQHYKVKEKNIEQKPYITQSG